MKPALVAYVFVIIIAAPGFAQEEFNPKAVESITLKIVQSGQLDVEGSVRNAKLSLYVPQEGVMSMDINSNKEVRWGYSNDTFGNKIVILEWENPSGTVLYSAEMIVKNSAKAVIPSADVGYDPLYLTATKSIVITDSIRKAAYPYEKTMENAARLTSFVYDFVEYDISEVGNRNPSDWVYNNRKGVCVEHANLLTALLRASGIPTRYVVGYAYSAVDKKLIGHTWVEVLDSNGNWIPFDPTWLQGGYADATHIKTANLLDDSQLDVLTYTGTGIITWKRGDATSDKAASITGDLYSDSVEIIDFKLRNMTLISLSGPDVPKGEYGYIRADISSSACVINQIKAQSCIDKEEKEVLDIYDKERSFFSCGSEEIYWFYRKSNKKDSYICPVVVFDQIGAANQLDVKRLQAAPASSIAIGGPDTVNVGEVFTLSAITDKDFIFYSPDFGRNEGKKWDMSINRPGSYAFYLYSEGNLAKKTVGAVEEKEFNIAVFSPSSAKAGESFAINVSARNLGDAKDAVLLIEFDSKRIERELGFGQGERKFVQLNISAGSSGQKELHASILGNTLTTYSAFVNVEGKGSVVDIAEVFANFIGYIAYLIIGVFT